MISLLVKSSPHFIIIGSLGKIVLIISKFPPPLFRIRLRIYPMGIRVERSLLLLRCNRNTRAVYWNQYSIDDMISNQWKSPPREGFANRTKLDFEVFGRPELKKFRFSRFPLILLECVPESENRPAVFRRACILLVLYAFNKLLIWFEYTYDTIDMRLLQQRNLI